MGELFRNETGSLINGSNDVEFMIRDTSISIYRYQWYL